MFRRRNTRSFKRNERIASLLSFIAGIVNVVGIITVFQLTTNVTGHFGYFIDEIFKFNFSESIIYLLFILAFLLGAFFSNIFVEIIMRYNERYIYVIPIIIESTILAFLAFFGEHLLASNPNYIALVLLFTMGLQNALVTIISNAIVRTTHLTGLFTDLGIELSQLFFYSSRLQKVKLHRTIRLRLRIIIFFFLGGFIGGLLFSKLGFHVFLIPVFLLLIGVFYDSFRYNVHKIREKLHIS